MVPLAALVLAAPAAAGNSQEAGISQSCDAGDSDDGSRDSDGDADSGGDCGNQDRIVRQSAGGDASRSITQRQSFDDDDRVRVRRDRDGDRDRDEEDLEEADASVTEEIVECDDFSSQADAQAALEEDSGAPSDLDADGDGRACEEEFTQAVSGAPEGGIETGGGGTLARADGTPGAATELARIAGPPLALALVVAGLVGLRRGRSA